MGDENNVTDSRLSQPNRKKNFGFPKYYPLPIVRNSDEENASWSCVIGHLKENSVEVSNEKDMELLFCQGFFGKGSLSRSTPKFLEEKFRERGNLPNSQKPTEQSQSNFLSLSVDQNKTESGENSTKPKKKDDLEIDLCDTASTSYEGTESFSEEEDDSNSVTDSATASNSVTDSASDSVTASKNDDKETLQLSLEEAYFLSYGLGVLVVKDKDQPLDLMRLWHKFCEIHPNQNFPVMYTAYHHFRSKGWIVRSGIKYGCDFVLYKDGPPFYHSSYAVIVKAIKEKNFRDAFAGGHPNFTWASLAAVHRICSHSNKGILILYVIKPASMSENKISTPFCVSQYMLEEVIVNRWVPSEEQNP